MKPGHMTLAIEMSDKMFVAVSKGTDALQLPSNQDFALRAIGIVLRSMGLAPATGRPMGYRAAALQKNRKPAVVKRRRRRLVNGSR